MSKFIIAFILLCINNINPVSAVIREPMDALSHGVEKGDIVLIQNKHDLIPLRRLDTLKIASINFGADSLNDFQRILSKYAPVDHFAMNDRLINKYADVILEEIESYNCIIIYNSSAVNYAARQKYSKNLLYLIHHLSNKNIILCHPANPSGIVGYLGTPVSSILTANDDLSAHAQYMAQAIFGGIPIKGKLQVAIHKKYPAGFGITTPKIRLGYTTPEACHISSMQLQRIDSICQIAIQNGATPGCQVLIAKDNYVIYNKAFGHHSYDNKKQNTTSDIYDIASVTKIAATMPAVMQLYDEHKIQLDTPLSAYLPELLHTNKEEITLEEVLAHHSGLKSFIPFFVNYLDTGGLDGKFMTKKPTPNNTLKIADRLYANPNIPFRDRTISLSPKAGYKFTPPGIYIYEYLQDSIMNEILKSEVNPKKEYSYSDIGFILIQRAIENITGESLDRYCAEHFYRKLGAYHTDFMGAERLDSNRIVPSSHDKLYRKGILKGYVHDPTAFLLGGIAGHAGLFSTAEDLAKIMSIYINGGEYGGDQFLSDSTIHLFGYQTNCYDKNRRGLGFDKPEFDVKKSSPACEDAPPGSFGHSGFTGTIAWCDPDHQLIYIFLSNRTFPSEFNNKLSDQNIRTKIQSVIYKAIENAEEEKKKSKEEFVG
ncbi:serine hydrolase [Porphyromonadaceae bacterium OttesenSCG-928-L07]|nr:serine hydrolase [Porphyromonadaceae bacterium OttesenSCG-928-L07]MDL2252215.1 serine hydrolase [Odoribacter sp. OttesenSCG-928-J03]